MSRPLNPSTATTNNLQAALEARVREGQLFPNAETQPPAMTIPFLVPTMAEGVRNALQQRLAELPTTDAGNPQATREAAIRAFAERAGVPEDQREEFVATQIAGTASLEQWNSRLDMVDRYRTQFEARYAAAGLNAEEVEAAWNAEAAREGSVI